MTNSPPTSFGTVAIVGVGLIGGSLAAALKRRGLATKILGVGRSRQKLQGAIDKGLLDEATESLKDAGEADLIVFCTPVERIAGGVREVASHCRKGTLITDAGSVKGTICRELTIGLPTEVTFIGSHPIAGSEKQGYEAALEDLFENKTCVVTPTDVTPRGELQRLIRFWEGVGSKVVELTPEKHDEILAATSHLPHLLAAALAATLQPDQEDFVGSGFRDTTRIAAGDAGLWQEILLSNVPALVKAANEFDALWKAFLHAVQAGEREKLMELLKVAEIKREQLNQKQT